MKRISDRAEVTAMKIKIDSEGPRHVHECEDCKPQTEVTVCSCNRIYMNPDDYCSLHASAPILLAACKEALDWVLCSDVRKQLQDAIANAEGK